MKRKGIFLVGLSLLMWACQSTDPLSVLTNTRRGTLQIQPTNYPAGGGVDLNLQDSGRVAQLDSVPEFLWDVKVLAYRTSQGGRPAMFLYGDNETTGSVAALDVSSFAGIATGPSGFDDFTVVTQAMQEGMAVDGVFDFDPNEDVDEQGNPDAVKLANAYAALVIGDKIMNLEPDQQPIYLVRSREELWYKFQMVERQGGGGVILQWAQFTGDAVE